jgi:hypothetical protein
MDDILASLIDAANFQNSTIQKFDNANTTTAAATNKSSTA